MKNNFVKMGLPILAGLLICACKKEQKQANFQENAQQWYLKKNPKAVLKSSKNEVLQVRREANWAEAKTFTLQDGTPVLSVPVAIKSASGNAKGSYLMLISKSSGDYKVQMAYNEQKDHFKAQRSATEINELFNGLNNVSSPAKTAAAKANNKVMADESGGGMRDEPSCTDWYWVEPTYDADGNKTGEVWTYLYRSCSSGGGDGGGGSDGGGTAEDPELAEAKKVIMAQNASQATSTALIEETATTRKKTYEWRFLENSFGMWHYTSTEEGTHVKSGDEWKWSSLTHKGIGRQGLTLGASITVEIKNSTPTVGIYNAGMTLYYNYSSSMLFKGFPVGIDFTGKANSPVWDVNY